MLFNQTFGGRNHAGCRGKRGKRREKHNGDLAQIIEEADTVAVLSAPCGAIDNRNIYINGCRNEYWPKFSHPRWLDPCALYSD